MTTGTQSWFRIRTVGVLSASLATLVAEVQGRNDLEPVVLGMIGWTVLAVLAIDELGRRSPPEGRIRTVLLGVTMSWLAVVMVAVACHRGYLPGPRGLLGSLVPFATHDRLAGTGNAATFLSVVALGVIVHPHLRSWPATRRLFPDRSGSGARCDHLMWSAALGIGIFGSSVVDLIARQHVEYSSVDSVTGRVIVFDGPLVTTIVWAACTAGALGLVIVPVLAAILTRRRRGTWVRPSFAVAMCGIISTGLLVRLGTLLAVAPTRTDGGDPLFYHVTANLLARGRGFPEPLNYVAFETWIPSALHGPLYPVVLSISSRLGGITYFDHKFLSLLIGTAVVALTALVTYVIVDATRRRHAALVAGLLAALYPNLWLVDGVLFPEGLMAVFTTAVVYLAYRWRRRPTFAIAVAIGAAIAASALTRGEGLALAGLLVVPWFLGHRDLAWRRRCVHVAVTGLTCLMVLAPWMIRNARSFDDFVPLSTNGNELFVYANCDDVYEGKFLGFWLFSCQEELRARGQDAAGDEAEKSLHWRRIGLDYAREHAGELPKVVAARIGRQWELFRPWQNTEFAPIEGRNKDAARFGLGMYYAMLPLAAVGLGSLRRHGQRVWPLLSIAAMVTITAAYAYGTTRFRVPAEPVLCILAGIGSVPAWERMRRRWSPDDRYRHRIDHNSFVLGGPILARIRPGRTATSWLLVALAVVVAVPALLRATGSTMEEGFMLVFPELVRRGWVPNVDFLHLYGPGSLYALAGWFGVFGTTVVTERLFGLLQHIALIAALTVLCRPWGRKVATVVGVSTTVFALSPIGLQALAWPGGVALGLWSVITALRARTRGGAWWVVSGAFAGLALTFRPDLVLALVLALSSLLWRRRRSLVIFLGGAVLGALPMWIHLLRAGVRASFDGMFLDPVFRLRGGRELPRPPSWDHLDGALQVIAEKFGPWWSIPHLTAAQQLFVWFFALPLVAVVVVVTALRMDHRRPARPVLVAAALFGAGLLPQAVQRPDSAHFLWVACVSWPLLIVAGVEFNAGRRPRTHPTVHLVLAATSLLTMLLVVAPFYTLRTYGDLVVRSLTNDLPVREVGRDGRFFYLGDERPWRASLQVVEALGELSRPGQRLFVGPVDLRQTAYSDAFFYHLFPDLEPATYFIEMDPGLANADGSRLANDVASADWLILTRFWSGWIEPNDSVVFGSDEPNRIVEDNFCLRRSFQNDLVRLYERCSDGDGIGPYDPPYRPEHDYAVEVLVPVPPRPDGTCTPTCWGRPSESGVEIGIDTGVLEPL